MTLRTPHLLLSTLVALATTKPALATEGSVEWGDLIIMGALERDVVEPKLTEQNAALAACAGDARGSVQLKATIDRKGNISKVKLKKASGFDDAAVACIERTLLGHTVGVARGGGVVVVTSNLQVR